MFKSLLGFCRWGWKGSFIAFAILFVSIRPVHGQTSDMNLPGYNRAIVHFGFIIAVNSTNFDVQPIANLAGHFADSLKTIRSTPEAGFNLGIVSELKLGKYLKLRFVPDLAFSQRDLAFFFMGISGKDTINYTVLKKIPSTFLDFPLDLKLISKRQKNFEAYVLGGGKYVTDLASQRNVNESLLGGNEVIRLIRNDFSYEAGAGIEFYLPYFKFGLEIKLSEGLRNLLIKDSTVYTQSLEYLKSRVFLVSLTFEG
jgi:hypothetical protein